MRLLRYLDFGCFSLLLLLKAWEDTGTQQQAEIKLILLLQITTFQNFQHFLVLDFKADMVGLSRQRCAAI